MRVGDKSIHVYSSFFEPNNYEEFLEAYTLDSIGGKLPVEELDVVFSVGGMLSKLPIEEASLEDGEYEFEIIEDIQGDIKLFF